jgi:hypothetical protein
LDCEIFLPSSGESERANGKGQSNRKGYNEGSPIRERQGVCKNDGGEDIDRASQDTSPVCAIQVSA